MAELSRKVGDFLQFLPYLLRPGTVVLRRFSRALGDNLMLSMLAREIKRARPGASVVLETNWPELFLNNPNVDLAVRTKVAPRYVKPGYRVDGDTSEHILDQLARSVGLDPAKIERRVELHLAEHELRAARHGLPDDYTVVCPQGKGTVAGNRKDWGIANFQALVDAAPERRWVQVGVAGDPLLNGVTDRRGLSVRESAAIIREASVAVILEGGVMHVCNAVGAPAVVIYGGAVLPEVSRYSDQLVVVAPAACGPCFRAHGRLGDCLARECMTAIKPHRVAELLRTGAHRRGGVLVMRVS